MSRITKFTDDGENSYIETFTFPVGADNSEERLQLEAHLAALTGASTAAQKIIQDDQTNIIVVPAVVIPVPAPAPMPVPAKKTRAQRDWRPNPRQQVILGFPAPDTRLMPLREYLIAMDRKTPYPKERQRNGQPATHEAAWNTGDEDLRNELKCERSNTWRAFRKHNQKSE